VIGEDRSGEDDEPSASSIPRLVTVRLELARKTVGEISPKTSHSATIRLSTTMRIATNEVSAT
jgi:hypothetical protein